MCGEDKALDSGSLGCTAGERGKFGAGGGVGEAGGVRTSTGVPSADGGGGDGGGGEAGGRKYGGSLGVATDPGRAPSLTRKLDEAFGEDDEMREVR